VTVDIFIPFWGDPELLHAAVRSVLAQDDPDWKLTVVDDCYPDVTVGDAVEALGDPRIRYLRNPVNLGLARNWTRCRDLATAELMMFLGCDDLLHPDFVATVHAVHADHPRAAVIEVGVQTVDEDGRRVRPLPDRLKRALMPRDHGRTELGGEALAVSLLRGNWLYWPSLVFRTDRIQQHEFREDLDIILDLALVIDMVSAGETLALDPTVCFSYRRHTASLSSATLVDGSRLPDERRYYAAVEAQMRALGLNRAATTARRRWISRSHALTLLPRAARARSGVRPLLAHAFGR
jgi:glycosyltransferase involved in cell wall biosynthesis